MYAVYAKVSSFLPERIFNLFRKDMVWPVFTEHALAQHCQSTNSKLFLKQFNFTNECLSILKFVFVLDNFTKSLAV